MKLGMMLEIDESFTTIWLSKSSEVRVKVRGWPQSPIGTIFLLGRIACTQSKTFISMLAATEYVGLCTWCLS